MRLETGVGLGWGSTGSREKFLWQLGNVGASPSPALDLCWGHHLWWHRHTQNTAISGSSPLPSYTSLLKDENYEKYEKDEDVFKFNACLAPAPAAPLPPQNTAQASHQQLQGRSPETWPGWNLSRSECGWWWCVWRVTVLCVTVWHGAMWSHLHHPNLFITAP